MVAALFYTQSELDEAIAEAIASAWTKGFIYGVLASEGEE